MGDQVREGDIIGDGPSTELGELALGRNVLVAFMPWNGYNFEDSILISERASSKTTCSPRSISKSSKSRLAIRSSVRKKLRATFRTSAKKRFRNLDEAGIVAIGAELEPGDILVGKVTPKGESPMTPEEKLLRLSSVKRLRTCVTRLCVCRRA
ncbi:MAG: hypothetical protein R3C27_13590 [Hyphomonadaceae bacterium]